MPVLKTSLQKQSSPQVNPPEVQLPLEPKYGGFGEGYDPQKGSIPVGTESGYKPLPHPQKEKHVLLSGNNCEPSWSEHEIDIQANVKIDQSTHKGSAPTFGKIFIGNAELGVVEIFKAKAGKLSLQISSDCHIDQDLSKEAHVKFRGVTSELVGTRLLVLRPTPLTAEEAGGGAISSVEKIGLAMSDGKNWIPISGSLNGRGEVGRLALFSGNKDLTSATSLCYVDGKFGVNCGDPQAEFHVGGVALAEGGFLAGELNEKSRAGTFGVKEGLPSFRTQKGFFRFGSGDGNIKGKGKSGYLPVFSDEDDIKASGLFYNTDKNVLILSSLQASTLNTKHLKLDDVWLTHDSEHLVFGGKALAYNFRRGVVKSSTLNVSGEGCVVDSHIQIEAPIASTSVRGLAQFSNVFTVKEGVVSLEASRLEKASFDSCGVLTKEDYKKFSNKADSFECSTLKLCDGLESTSEIKIIGKPNTLRVRHASYTESGIVQIGERDFELKDGVLSLRNTRLSESVLSEALAKKQDLLPIKKCDVVGDGFVGDTKFFVVNGVDCKIELEKASNEKFGIAKFSNQFDVTNGLVSLKNIGEASRETSGLLSGKMFGELTQLLDEKKSFVSNKCESGYIPFMREGVAQKSPLHLKGSIVESELGFHAESLVSNSLVRVGAFDGDAANARAGSMRFERGGLEVSNGEIWLRLATGGVTGRGKENCLAIWNDNESLTQVDGLIFDQKLNRLGLGTTKPSYGIHLDAPTASLGIVSTRASSASSGGLMIVGCDDGQLLGVGDELGKIGFTGKGIIGAQIRAVSSANWESTSSPTGLAFGVCQDGQNAPTDHMFLTAKGYLGIGVAKPLAPLHVASQNKDSVSACFSGGIKIGDCQSSASIVGKGVLRFNHDALEISDGSGWKRVSLMG